jgi:hypothetical protein
MIIQSSLKSVRPWSLFISVKLVWGHIFSFFKDLQLESKNRNNTDKNEKNEWRIIEQTCIEYKL